MYDIEEYSHIRILHILLLIGIGVGLTIIVFLPDHTPPRRAQNFIHCRMARFVLFVQFIHVVMILKTQRIAKTAKSSKGIGGCLIGVSALVEARSHDQGKAREAAKGKKTEQAKVTAVAALVLQCKICKVQLNNTKSAKVLQLHVDSKVARASVPLFTRIPV
jgi:hypothetical protein